ncbi:MAG TPA: hypothetical protein VFQ61_14810 [Polyangiaceae bacterium]|nr:hypothetical protein [Polyangiaceae bacterium]
MRVRRLIVSGVVSLSVVFAAHQPEAHAEETGKAAKPGTKPVKRPRDGKSVRATGKAGAEGKSASEASPTRAESLETAPAEARGAERDLPSRSSGPKDSETKAGNGTASSASSATVKEAEGPEGVKTYQFGAIEVEGRLKSPQLIYFLRRVRAEFRAGALGHRSFLGELSDTRREAAFR